MENGARELVRVLILAPKPILRTSHEDPNVLPLQAPKATFVKTCPHFFKVPTESRTSR